jgi:hypothetical protein
MASSKSTNRSAASAAEPDLDKDERTDEPVSEPSAEVSDPNESVHDERQDGPGYVPEQSLTTEAVIQRRTSTIDGGPEWPADGRYHKVFNVATPRLSSGKFPELDWYADEHQAMHEANKVAVLQEALARGLHPREAAEFVGPMGDPDEASASAALEYSVKVVPATEDGVEAASTFTPSAAIQEQGGTTLPGSDSWSDNRE